MRLFIFYLYFQLLKSIYHLINKKYSIIRSQPLSNKEISYKLSSKGHFHPFSISNVQNSHYFVLPLSKIHLLILWVYSTTLIRIGRSDLSCFGDTVLNLWRLLKFLKIRGIWFFPIYLTFYLSKLIAWMIKFDFLLQKTAV